jgi:hypothetical protein
MTCIACGSDSGFRCTIKGLTVCLCEKHMEERDYYDAVVAETLVS